MVDTLHDAHYRSRETIAWEFAALLNQEAREIVLDEVDIADIAGVLDKDAVLVKSKDMPKVTSKLQVTVPKAIADRYGIRPGDHIQWVPAGDTIRVVPPGRRAPVADLELRLKLFDAATERQRLKQASQPRRRASRTRGWKREDLYARGRSR